MRDHVWLAQALGPNAVLTASQGDWQTSRDFSDRALSLLPRSPRLLSQRALLEFQVGDFDTGMLYLEQLVGLSSPEERLLSIKTYTIPLAGLITNYTENFDVAETAGERVLSAPTMPLISTFAQLGRAIIAVQRGDHEGAANLHAALLPVRGIFFLGSLSPPTVCLVC